MIIGNWLETKGALRSPIPRRGDGSPGLYAEVACHWMREGGRNHDARDRAYGNSGHAGASVFALTACGAGNDAADVADTVVTAGRLVLAVERAETGADGRRCMFGVTARNDTGAGALNVQAAWMAQTDGFGIISDYQMLGDFAAGEARSLRLGVIGAPCDAVRDLRLTRAVCVVGPAESPPQSCAELVMLDGGGVVAVRRD